MRSFGEWTFVQCKTRQHRGDAAGGELGDSGIAPPEQRGAGGCRAPPRTRRARADGGASAGTRPGGAEDQTRPRPPSGAASRSSRSNTGRSLQIPIADQADRHVCLSSTAITVFCSVGEPPWAVHVDGRFRPRADVEFSAAAASTGRDRGRDLSAPGGSRCHPRSLTGRRDNALPEWLRTRPSRGSTPPGSASGRASRSATPRRRHRVQVARFVRTVTWK
jgi:hypothetical protein